MSDFSFALVSCTSEDGPSVWHAHTNFTGKQRQSNQSATGHEEALGRGVNSIFHFNIALAKSLDLKYKEPS